MTISVRNCHLLKVIWVDCDSVLYWCPFNFFKHRNNRNWDVGEHEKWESEHRLNANSSLCAHFVSFHKKRNHAKCKHEKNVVSQAENDRRQAGRHNHAGAKHPANPKDDNYQIKHNCNNGYKQARGDGHKHVIACEAMPLRVCKNVSKKLPAIANENLVKTPCPAKTLVSRILECNRLFVI